jgi:ribulose-bisphosphate carboxylase large chain
MLGGNSAIARGALTVARISGERFWITYQLTCAKGEDPAVKARDITFEQTVEMPTGSFPAEIEERIVGKVEALERLEGSRWRAVLSYNTLTIGTDLPQFLNLLFGNISLKSGIRVTDIEWPASLLDTFRGPEFGVAGLRELCGVRRRPLLCAALKPMGFSAGELADLCYQLALGGIDIIKDDHGLANQQTAPFRHRVEQCQVAVTRANQLTGGNSLYFPNVTSGASEIHENVKFARGAGCRGILISPLLVGLDTVRWIAESAQMPIFAHPSLAGAFFAPDHGIAAEILLGQIFRIAGSDGVIYPNAGGRFSFSEETCEAINWQLRKPLGYMNPSFPVPGGGISIERVPYWIDRYGIDTIFLIGGSLYIEPDLEQASKHLVDSVRRHCGA